MTNSWERRYSRRAKANTGSAIRALLKLTEQPEFISLAGGLPAPESFPIAEIAAAADTVLHEHGAAVLQYSATEGYRPLRELVAQRVSTTTHQLTAENVLITSGSQQALDLLGKVFIDSGDKVIVESPTYLAALQAWNAYEAHYLAAPMDEAGLDPAQLAPLFAQDPKFLYCVPNFQNPTGVTMTLERRQQLVALGAAHQLPLIEDDPYGSLRFEEDALPSLLALADPDDLGVIQLSTISKTLAPGLRVGWIIGPPELISRVALAKQGTDLHTGSLDQAIVHHLIATGFVEHHLPSIVARYRERRDVMLAALNEHFPASTSWTHPTGGMFVWVTLPAEVDATELLSAAIEQGVAFVPGGPFHPDGSGRNTMRLNFSNASPERIATGIARLGNALREF